MERRLKQTLLLIIVSAVTLIALSCNDGLVQAVDAHLELTDKTAPEPPNDGEITVVAERAVEVEISWGPAFDQYVEADRLEYRVYYSDSASLETKDQVLSNGTPASDWIAALAEYTITGLEQDTDYDVNVLVRDSAATPNVAAYRRRAVHTIVDDTEPSVLNPELVESDHTPYSFRVSWTAAEDLIDPPDRLTYQVFYSESQTVATVNDMLANGTAAGPPQADVTSHQVAGLSEDTEYNVNVLVRDAVGNSAHYQMRPISTLADQPPVPGGGIELSAILTDAFTVSWDPATDDEDEDVLEYRVFYTDSGPNDMDDYAAALALATPANSFTEDLTSLAIGGLDEITVYYVNIFVRDRMDSPVPYGTVSQRTARRDRLYWTNDTSDVYRTFLDYTGGDLIEAIHDVSSGTFDGIAIDYDGERVYWTDGSNGTIWTKQLDGVGSADAVINSGLTWPYGLAITSDGTELYVSDYSGDTIYRVPASLRDEVISHASVDTIFTSDGSGPTGLALSVDEQDLYFVRYDSGHISKVDVSTLGVTPDVVPAVFFVTPLAIAVDSTAIYWADTGTSTTVEDGHIEYALLIDPGDPANQFEMITSGAYAPQGIAIGPDGTVYWIDYQTEWLYRAQTPLPSEGAAATYQYVPVDGPNGLAIYAQY